MLGEIAAWATILVTLGYLPIWWARKNGGNKLANKIIRIVEDTDAWAPIEVQCKIEWVQEAIKEGKLEGDADDYGWANADKLGVDGREVVEILDYKQRKRQIFKYGASSTLVRKRKN